MQLNKKRGFFYLFFYLHKQNNMKNIIISVLVFLSLTSCIEQNLTVKNDMSGNYNISLKASDDAINLVKSTNNTNSSIDQNLFFLMSEEDIKNVLKKERSIRARQINISEDERYKNYDIDLTFKTIESIPDIFLNKYISNQIYNIKGTIFIKTIINPANNQTINNIYNGLSDDKRSIINAYSDMVTLTLSYNCPSEIIKTQSIKKGVLTQSNKSIEYKYSLTEILQTKTNIEILISFKK